MKQIENVIAAVVKDLFDVEIEVSLNRPDPKHGDYATNVAMILAKKLGKSPREVAEAIFEELDSETIEKTEVAGPGFINIRLSQKAIVGLLNANGPDKSKSKRILVEFGHPNTHKLPHIGHAFSYFAGESIARLLEHQGHTVKRANYQGDVGPHVAKCIYGWHQLGQPRPDDAYERVKVLQESYQKGAELYENAEHKEKIDELNRGIYQNDPQWQADWEETRQWSIDYYTNFEAAMDIGEQRHYFESEVWQRGTEIVRANEPGVFKSSQGAIVYEGEKIGVHTRVFLTKAGTATYEGKEMGLTALKLDEWDFDLNVTPTAAEQNEYFQVTFAAAEEIFPELKGKLTHIGFGFVNLTTGKMSSRTGQILSAPELVETVLSRVREINQDNDKVPEKDKEAVNQQIATSAIKFGFLKSTLTKNITFDPDSSTDLHGDTGPYVQYTHARIKSILRKSEQKPNPETKEVNEAERQLIIHLGSFEQTAQTAAEQYEPHHICNYLLELCRQFNSYYADNPIIGSDNEAFRLHLIEQVADKIKTGLHLLSIKAPEHM